MKKKAIIISIPFIVIAAVVVYFFVRYSSVERSIYLKNLKYRFDWKLECARESDYSEKRDSDVHYYLDVLPYKNYGNTPDESSRYLGDDAKRENKERFNNNEDAQSHRAKIEKELQ